MRRRPRTITFLTTVLLAALALLAGSTTRAISQGVGEPVVGSKNGKVYHEPSCSSARRLSEANLLSFPNPGVAEAKGYRACQSCKPNRVIQAVSLFAPITTPGPMTSGGAPNAASAQDEEPGDGPKFTSDVAPIFVANCVRCHNPEDRRGGFDLSTFRALMTGAESGAVIEAKRPDASELILRVKGESTPKMPPGNTNLAPETIASIEAWISAGALLDAGADPNASLADIAVSPDQLRDAELARLSPEERRERLTEAAQTRWTLAGAGELPDLVAGKRFLMFAAIPESRAEQAVKTLDKALESIGPLLTRPGKSGPVGPMEVSVYVFANRNHYAEFVRTVSRQEPAEGEEARADLSTEEPYVVALDPLGGNEAIRDGGGAARGLGSILVEQFAAGAIARSDPNAPRWLALGYGAFMASKLEPRGPYVARLRAGALRAAQIGWRTKAGEAIGDLLDPDETRAIGFSLFEWLTAANPRMVGPFVRGMLGGKDQLDAGVQQLFGVDRNQFLTVWGQWVAARYARGR